MLHLSRRTFLQGLAASALALFSPRFGHAETLRMRDLYNKDLSFSDSAKSLEGTRITVGGFMAPPLKAELTFFVLTKRPMAVCPFCSDEAEWPDDILAVYTKRVVEVISFNVPILTHGILELGAFTDPETGFVSRVRLTDSTYERRS